MYDGSDDESALWQERYVYQSAGRASAMYFKFSIAQDESQPRLALYFGQSLTGASGVGPFVCAFLDCLLSCSETTGSVVCGDMFVDGDLGALKLTLIKANLVQAEEGVSRRHPNH